MAPQPTNSDVDVNFSSILFDEMSKIVNLPVLAVRDTRGEEVQWCSYRFIPVPITMEAVLQNNGFLSSAVVEEIGLQTPKNPEKQDLIMAVACEHTREASKYNSVQSCRPITVAPRFFGYTEFSELICVEFTMK